MADEASSRHKIKAKFVDFWTDDARENELYRYISDFCEIELADEPDYLFYSDFGAGAGQPPRRSTQPHNPQYRRAVKIYYSGERNFPRMWECHYAFSMRTAEHPRSYRFPLYKLYMSREGVSTVAPRSEREVEAILSQQSQFCYFIASNNELESAVRQSFFHRLSEYKRVDSGGAVLNNIGYQVGRGEADREFRRQYRFAIAFENFSAVGYTTEKLYTAYTRGSVPIYWGNPDARLEFNPAAFINAHDFDSFDDLIEYVKRVDSDAELYRAYLQAPLFVNGRDNDYIRDETLYGYFAQIFSSPAPQLPPRPVSDYLARASEMALRVGGGVGDLYRLLPRIARKTRRLLKNLTG